MRGLQADHNKLMNRDNCHCCGPAMSKHLYPLPVVSFKNLQKKFPIKDTWKYNLVLQGFSLPYVDFLLALSH